MTVQSTNSISLLFVQNSTNHVTSGKEQGFDSYLQMNTKNTDAALEKQQNNVTSKDNTVAPAQNSLVNKKENVQTDCSDSSITEEEVVESLVSAETETLLESQELPDEVLAEIMAVLNQIVTVIQELTAADAEQLFAATQELEFGMTDFFRTDKVKELFLQLSEADTTELLTDENLYQSLERLQDVLNELVDEHGITELLQPESFGSQAERLQSLEEQLGMFIRTDSQTADVSQEENLVVTFAVESDAYTTGDKEYAGIVADTDVSDADEIVLSESEPNSEQNSFGHERNTDQAGLFLQRLAESVRTTNEESAPISETFGLYDIASQIIEQVKIHIRPDNTRMELQLNPEQLGKVELEISSKNGELSAKLNVQNDQVKEAVESQMQVLRETLEAQGLKVENIEVTVAEFGFRFQDENSEAQQQQQRRFGSTRIELEDAEADEQNYSDVTEVMKELNGNTIDYVA